MSAYAGIGAHETPPQVLELMRAGASALARAGWTLCSGNSAGADRAFYGGALQAGGAIELYLPHPGFGANARRREDERRARVLELARPAPAAYELAERFCPGWATLGPGQRALSARDVHQVLGARLEDPVALVICWTAEGDLDGSGPRAGGTGQALRLARARAIPVANLCRGEHAERLRRVLSGPAAGFAGELGAALQCASGGG